MWLYVPSHCLRVSEDSTSEYDLLFLRLERFVTWKGKSMPPQFWRRAWDRETWTRLLSTATLNHSTLAHGVERWILFTVGSHASHTPSPASKKATKTTGRSGPSSPESWPSVDPPWSSSRTSQLSLLGEDFDLSERNYADWVTNSKIRSSSVQATLAHLTSASGSSSSPTIWQTPKDSTGGNVSRSGDRKDELLLAGQAEEFDLDYQKPLPNESSQAYWERMTKTEKERGITKEMLSRGEKWPTPQATDEQRDRQSDEACKRWKARPNSGSELAVEARSWPTPTSQDSESHGSASYTTESGRHSGTTLTDKTREFEERGRWGENQYPTPSVTQYGSGQNEGKVEHVRPSRGTPSLFQWASTPQARKISTSGKKSSSTHPTSRRRLNPAFVCSLLGWPWYWTRTERINSVAQVMESYRLALGSLLESFLDGLD